MQQPMGHIRIHIADHGQFQTSAEGFDRVIAEYLPASVAGLRDKIRELDGALDYSDLRTVTECLMVLAELRGYATN